MRSVGLFGREGLLSSSVPLCASMGRLTVHPSSPFVHVCDRSCCCELAVPAGANVQAMECVLAKERGEKGTALEAR